MITLNIQTQRLEIQDHLYLIPAFDKINKEDKSKSKDKFHDFIKYLYFMYDFKSPYFDYPESKRIIECNKAGIEYKITKTEQAAIDIYKEMLPMELRFLSKAFSALDKMGDYLETVDFTATNEEGHFIHDPNKVNRILADAGKTLDSMLLLREKANKALSNQTTKLELSPYEDEDDEEED